MQFDPAALTGGRLAWFEAWHSRSEAATAVACAAVESGLPVAHESRVWRDLKSWLLQNVFGGKCGYCEWRTGRSYGAADHYRPKGALLVPSVDGKLVPEIDSLGALHSGYYWLAYRWWNLIPSCDHCNTTGKASQFPIQGTRVFSGDALNHLDSRKTLDEIERPLLLNPYFDDPAEHLRFGAQGLVVPAEGSERGSESIRVLKLDDGFLNEERKRVQEQARTAVADAFMLAGKGFVELEVALDDVLEKYASFSSPFSAAARAAVLAQIDEVSRAIASFQVQNIASDDGA